MIWSKDVFSELDGLSKVINLFVWILMLIEFSVLKLLKFFDMCLIWIFIL